MDVYEDPGITYVETAVFCFEPGGTWYLVSGSGGSFSGYWMQNGNDFRFHGTNSLHTYSNSGELTRIAPDRLAGYRQSWGDGNQGYFFVADATFQNVNCDPPQ